MNNVGARLVVLGLGDPHGLEGGKGGEDRGAEPAAIHALNRCVNLDFVVCGNKCKHFVPEALADALKERGPPAEDHILEEIAPNIIVALHHRIEAIFMNAFKFVSRVLWLEENLRAAESLISNQDLSAIR